MRPLELRGVTGAEVVPSVYVEKLEAGAIVLERQRLPVVTPSVFADADGILGVEGFAHMCLHADFVRRSIAILKNGCPRTSDNWARARATLRFGGLLTIKARMKGPSRLAAIIDTGAERSLGNLALLRALKLEQKAENPATATNVFGATSHRASGHVLTAPRLFLGDLEVADLNVTFGDFDVFRLWGLEDEPALVIGMDVLGTVRRTDDRLQAGRVARAALRWWTTTASRCGRCNRDVCRRALLQTTYSRRDLVRDQLVGTERGPLDGHGRAIAYPAARVGLALYPDLSIGERVHEFAGAPLAHDRCNAVDTVDRLRRLLWHALAYLGLAQAEIVAVACAHW